MSLPKRALRYLYSQSIRLAGRASTPYASHVPILVAVSNLVQASKVVEFGSGEFSTMSFLDQRAFPRLRVLRSFENDRKWHAKIAELVASDARVSLEFVDGAVANAATLRNLDGAELIFVDDSDMKGRIRTIEAIAQFHLKNVPVIVHDYDHWRLRRVGRLFERRFCFSVWNPQTAVLWNGNPKWAMGLGNLAKVLQKHQNHAPLHDAVRWRQVLLSNPASLSGLT
jgi:hypothetical protein